MNRALNNPAGIVNALSAVLLRDIVGSNGPQECDELHRSYEGLHVWLEGWWEGVMFRGGK